MILGDPGIAAGKKGLYGTGDLVGKGSDGASSNPFRSRHSAFSFGTLCKRRIPILWIHFFQDADILQSFQIATFPVFGKCIES